MEPVVRRICCISPNRSVLDELAPLLMRCLPGASLCDVRSYPTAQELPHEFGSQPPELCFVDVIANRDLALDTIRAITLTHTQTHVIALLGADEPDLILKCLRSGAYEFLRQPLDAKQLETALGKLKAIAGTEPSLAKVYAVVPAKGACGASTVACNLAFQWKRLGFKRVLLADMDSLTGSVSFLLKVRSEFSFLDVLQRADTLDADLWKGMVSPCAGIDVLLAPELLVEGISEARDASPIVEFARKNYDIVILDTGGAYGEWNLSQARASDEVLLVTTNELPALHGAQRALSYLESNHIPKWKFRLIINRYDKNIGLSKEVVAAALHINALQTIPSSYETVQKALLDGKPVPLNTPLGKMFTQLGDKLAGRDKEPAPRSMPFGGLFSLFSRISL